MVGHEEPDTGYLPPDTPLAVENGGWIDGSADLDKVARARDRSAAAEQHLRTLVDGVPQLLWRSSDMGHWTWASSQWLTFTGQSQEESHDRGWLDAVHPDDREHTLAAWKEARRHGQLDVEFRVRRAADGAYLWHRTRSNPVRDRAGRIVEWLGSTTDIEELKVLQHRQLQLLDEQGAHAHALESEITQRERVEAQLLHEARHDGLTGLFNRSYFMDRLRLVLEQRVDCAVLLLDLDRFKLVNDSLGHQTGDLLLKEMAGRLKACVRPPDTLARFGGDEFVLLVEAQPHSVVEIAEHIAAALHQPLWLGEQEVFSSCSIGVVRTIAGYGSPEAVLRDADIAMYTAKRRGSGSYAVFDNEMHDNAVQALSLRTDLRHALSRGELRVHYQPICMIGTGRVVALEALVRWQHGQRGIVSPGEFIPVAEEIGLISELGRWVLREACAQLQHWHDRFPELPLRISVNTSGEELANAGFLAGLRNVLNETSANPNSLQIEVTESIFLRNADQVGAVLGSIRELGVKVALDDFGTGYSSLSYLDRFQVDTIKIDRSFVTGLPDRPRCLAIIGTVLRLGEALGFDVIVEGVEEPGELRVLQDAGCRLVQGYLTGRPVSASSITTLLERQMS